MSKFEETAGNRMGAGLLPETGLTLARTFLAAWLTAIAAVIVLPAILVFGIATGIVRWMTPRKRSRAVILEGEYRVLGPETKNA